MLTNHQEMADLILTLIDSTTTYSASRIGNTTNRHSYIKAMSRCRNICAQSGSDIWNMTFQLKRLNQSAPRTFIKRFEPFSSTKGYYMMGIHHCMSIVESINVRFEKGYHSDDEVFVRSILGDLGT